jgi:hypothetical protein
MAKKTAPKSIDEVETYADLDAWYAAAERPLIEEISAIDGDRKQLKRKVELRDQIIELQRQRLEWQRANLIPGAGPDQRL